MSYSLKLERLRGLVDGYKVYLFLISIVGLLIAPIGQAAAFTFENSSDSDQAIVIVGERFTSPAIREATLGCPSGFKRHGLTSTCYKCDRGYKRSTKKVSGGKACYKKGSFPRDYARATISETRYRKKCPDGAFRHRLTKRCYSCPSEFLRTSDMVPSMLEENPNACEPNGYFYEIVEPGQRVSGAANRPIYNLSRDPNEVLKFSVFATEDTDGFSEPVKNPAKGPGLTPMTKAKEVVSFKMRAKDFARIKYEAGFGSATITRHGETGPSKLVCLPMQPGDHSGNGLNCEQSTTALDQYQR